MADHSPAKPYSSVISSNLSTLYVFVCAPTAGERDVSNVVKMHDLRSKCDKLQIIWTRLCDKPNQSWKKEKYCEYE